MVERGVGKKFKPAKKGVCSVGRTTRRDQLREYYLVQVEKDVNDLIDLQTLTVSCTMYKKTHATLRGFLCLCRERARSVNSIE